MSLTSITRLLAPAIALVSAGCYGLSQDEGKSCRNSSDCAEICSPIGECVLAASALDVRVSWTINGVAPSPATPESCGNIDAFELRFDSDSIRDEVIAYFPVPCENGTVFYPSMPERLVLVTLTGFDALGAFVSSQSRDIVDRQSEFTIDFRL